jgi:ABC-type Fe3+-hydroxamate transport system substrate-binding protein
MTENETVTTVATTPRKGGRKKLIIGGAVLAVLVIGGIGAAAGKGSSSAAAPTEVTKTVTAPAAPPVTKTVTVTAPPVTVTAPAPPPVTVTVAPPAPVVVGPAEKITKSGIYVVGKDIKAGKWRTDGGGYFAILADPTASTSDVDNILTNDNPDGQAFATLEDGQGLETNRMTWTWMGE